MGEFRLSERLDKKVCIFHAANEVFSIREKSKDGEAEIPLVSEYECFHVCADKDQFFVLENKRCADCMVFIYDSDQWSLHIFELTKTVDSGKWETKILPQFDGALLNAYAIRGITEMPEFSSVTVYCAYRFNRDLSSPASLKRPLGKPVMSPWFIEGDITLPDFPEFKVKKKLIELDQDTGRGTQTQLGI